MAKQYKVYRLYSQYPVYDGDEQAIGLTREGDLAYLDLASKESGKNGIIIIDGFYFGYDKLVLSNDDLANCVEVGVISSDNLKVNLQSGVSVTYRYFQKGYAIGLFDTNDKPLYAGDWVWLNGCKERQALVGYQHDKAWLLFGHDGVSVGWDLTPESIKNHKIRKVVAGEVLLPPSSDWLSYQLPCLAV